MSQASASKRTSQGPDAHLEALITQVKHITEAWATRHDLWHDSAHKDPLKHYKDEPGRGAPLLLLCSDGPAMSSLRWDDDLAYELRGKLEEVGVCLELEDSVTACYQLVDSDSELQKEFDRYAQWKWICRLIEADSEEVSGDLYQYFAENPDDFHRLPHREFEKLISTIFVARGWRTELGPGSGDEGVDLRIWQSDPLGDLLTLVQIKRYASHRPINLEAVAALETHVNREGANRGLFVTSSRFLPGVHEFASRNKHRLQLADSTNLQRWCEESAHATRTSRNRALAMKSFAPLVDEIRMALPHPRLVVGERYGPHFVLF
ncbi:restriction endonuclease [Paraburkholderia sediminicola]|uniref:restriction endonuclease n=1 Tax=Paraburkholderia sediminicola TaxID=458836 RepID=UPI0038B8F5F7